MGDRALRPRRYAPTTLAVQQRPAPVPVLEVVGGPGRLSRDSLAELWHFREVLWAFVLRQVKVKYKQAAVGIGWAVIQPLLAALVFALFLFRYGSIPSEGGPALLFTLAGMAGGSYFSSATALASESLVTNQALLRKIYFPREVLPLSGVLAGVLDLFLGLAVLVIVTFSYAIAPALSWVALPLPLLLLVVAAAAFGIALSAVDRLYPAVPPPPPPPLPPGPLPR